MLYFQTCQALMRRCVIDRMSQSDCAGVRWNLARTGGKRKPCTVAATS